MNPGRLKLLVVDDETDVCTYVQKYFGKRDFIVSTTGSGLEALSMIKTSKPDMILLDLTLNELNGQEVLERLREYDKDTKVIVVSGLQNPKDIDKLYSLGINGYYVKPVILEEIAKLVYEALGIKQLINEIATPKQKIYEPKVGGGSKTHQLSNKLNIIRGDCESFVLDYEDGLYKNKTSDELLKMSIEIMKDVQKTVDSTMEVIKKIEEQ